MRYAGMGQYYTQSAQFNAPIDHCLVCDVYCRDVSATIIDSHCDAASYVQLENEAHFWAQRQQFFEYVLSVAWKSLSKRRHGMKLVDFGSSYGHLLKLAEAVGFEPIGIEVNKRLIEYSREQGLQVLPTLDDVKEPIDVFLFVDSLYYLPDPRTALNKVVRRLKPEGVGIIRVTNRNLFARMNLLAGRPTAFSVLGDAIVSYSAKGLRRLLQGTGLEIVTLLPDTGYRKKNLSLQTRLLYRATTLLTTLTQNRAIFTPGIIAVVRLQSSGRLSAEGKESTTSPAMSSSPEYFGQESHEGLGSVAAPARE